MNFQPLHYSKILNKIYILEGKCKSLKLDNFFLNFIWNEYEAK